MTKKCKELEEKRQIIGFPIEIKKLLQTPNDLISIFPVYSSLVWQLFRRYGSKPACGCADEFSTATEYPSQKRATL